MRESSEYSDNFSNYYDSIEQIVPETTFNNMHGKLRDINSVDGQTWKYTMTVFIFIMAIKIIVFIYYKITRHNSS